MAALAFNGHKLRHSAPSCNRYRWRAGVRAVTLIELLVVIAILTVLLAMLVPVLAKVRNSSRAVQCTGNLRGIGASFLSYANANQGRLPDPGFADKSWEQLITQYYTGKFQCPSDCELYPGAGSSYDWRDTGVNSTTMAGKLLADSRRLDAVLAFEALPGWHTKGNMNAVALDGSVRTMDATECLTDLETPVRDGPPGPTWQRKR
jgi:prepilin-type N-terminal cleavage/methylation domain-containing protein